MKDSEKTTMGYSILAGITFLFSVRNILKNGKEMNRIDDVIKRNRRNTETVVNDLKKGSK